VFENDLLMIPPRKEFVENIFHRKILLIIHLIANYDIHPDKNNLINKFEFDNFLKSEMVYFQLIENCSFH
jgi:hypothetical protein